MPASMRARIVIAICLLSATACLHAKVEDVLSNPGFEHDEAGWIWGSGDKKMGFSQVTSAAAHSGEKGLRVVKEGENGGSSVASARFKVTPGSVCTLQYWIHTNRSGSGAVYLRFYNQEKKPVEFMQVIPQQSEVWVAKSMVAQVPSDAVSGEIWIHAATKGAVAFDVDDFSIAFSEVSGDGSTEERIKSIASMLDKAPSGMGPQITDRAAWSALSTQPAFKSTVQLAEFEIKQPMPVLSDALYLEYSKTGVRLNNDAANSKFRERLRILVLAECLENKGRFLPEIEKMLAAQFSLKSWVGSAHDKDLGNFHGQKTEVDLYAAIMASSLATADWLLQDRIKSETRALIRSELQRRIFTPYLKSVRTDSHEGMIGWWRYCTNNWNATCHANITGAALTLLESPQERAEFISAAEAGIKHYLDGITDEGFSSEGLGYGQRAFGDYELLAEAIAKATHGKINLYASDKVWRFAQFPVRMEMLPGLYPAFGDCWAKVTPLRWVLDIANTRYGFHWDQWEQRTLVDLGDNLYAAAGILNLNRADKPLYRPTTAEAELSGNRVRDWFAQSGILIARPDEPSGSLALAVKGGHSINNRGHEHADSGSFVVALNKKILLVDPGAPVYTSATFASQRFENPIINSYGHSAPVVAGKFQMSDVGVPEVLHKDFTDACDVLSLNLKNAYDVPGLETLTRQFKYERQNHGAVTVTDHVVFATPQEFGVALMTFSRWRPVDDRTLVVYDGPSAIEVTIDTNGLPFIITEDMLKESPEPRRLGINLKSKTREATISIRITPKVSTAATEDSGGLDLSGIQPNMGRAIQISAVSLVGESGGGVQAASKSGTTGPTIKSWDKEGHRLAWDVIIPEDGLYALKLRYCHDMSGDSLREIQIDGVAAPQSQVIFAFPRTGGWSNETDDWKEAFAIHGKKPAGLFFSKGKHQLALINRGGSLNLDWLKLIPVATENK